MNKVAEKRDFRMHPELLWSVIRSQAGTISKAFLELVMNSIDAGASKVTLVFDRNTFSVLDDGKGFTSRREIEDWFETFGTPHQAGDATYGKFRMGRGQIFSFAKNAWISNTFRMDVDIKARGLEYDLHENQPVSNGCSVSGVFYDEISPSESILLMQEIQRMCKYAPVPVFCNGKMISVDMTNEKWTHEDDDAWFKLSASKNFLEVYNRGVMVRSYSAGQYGCGGIIISKKQLEVNFSRNDILISQCQVWKRVSAVARAYATSCGKKSVVKNEAWREMMCAKLVSEDFTGEADVIEFLETAQILTDISGKHYSIFGLLTFIERNACKIVMEAGGSVEAMENKLQAGKLAVVIAGKTLDRFNQVSCSFAEIMDVAIKCAGGQACYYTPKLLRIKAAVCTVSDLMSKHGITNDVCIVDNSSLSKPEQAMLSVITTSTERLMWTLHRSGGLVRSERKIRIIESDVVESDTNCEIIFLNRKLLTLDGYSPFGHFCKIASMLLHEYLHDKDDRSGIHEHNAEFYQFYERCSAEFVGLFIERAIHLYSKAIESGKVVKFRKSEARIADASGLYDGSESDPELKPELNLVITSGADQHPEYSF